MWFTIESTDKSSQDIDNSYKIKNNEYVNECRGKRSEMILIEDKHVYWSDILKYLSE